MLLGVAPALRNDMGMHELLEKAAEREHAQPERAEAELEGEPTVAHLFFFQSR